MKKFGLCGLGNAIVDLLFECSEETFQQLDIIKGGMRLIDTQQQELLIGKLGQPIKKSSGGSVANSVALFAELGAKSNFICSISDDPIGQFFKTDMSKIGVVVSTGGNKISNKASGTSVVIVTPDAERSMSTCLGASSLLSKANIDQTLIAKSEWLFIEGYLIANSDESREAILTAIELAKSSDTKVALTLSDAFVVEGFFDFIRAILPKCDLLFCNFVEATALANKLEDNQISDCSQIFKILCKYSQGLAMTHGADGVYIKDNNDSEHIAAVRCKPVDLTGAGDAFAGAFLSAICNKEDSIRAAKKACFFASKVIQQWGARLEKPAELISSA